MNRSGRSSGSAAFPITGCTTWGTPRSAAPPARGPSSTERIPGWDVGGGRGRSTRSAGSTNRLTGPTGRNRQSRPSGARKETGEHGPPRRPGEPEHLHHSRGVPQVPGPRDAVVDREGFDDDSVAGPQGILRPGSLPARPHRYELQAPRDDRVPRPDGPRMGRGPDRPPGRGGVAGQGAGLLTAGQKLRVEVQGPAAGALGPIPHLLRTGDARPDPSAPLLDRTRRLGIHPPREDLHMRPLLRAGREAVPVPRMRSVQLPDRLRGRNRRRDHRGTEGDEDAGEGRARPGPRGGLYDAEAAVPGLHVTSKGTFLNFSLERQDRNKPGTAFGSDGSFPTLQR